MKSLEEYKKEYGAKLGKWLHERHPKNKSFPWTRTRGNIIQRCTNLNSQYAYYGGRGIKCLVTNEELRELFIRDKAWLFKTPCIDRKNPDKDYTKSNLKWVEKADNKPDRFTNKYRHRKYLTLKRYLEKSARKYRWNNGILRSFLYEMAGEAKYNLGLESFYPPQTVKDPT